MGTEDKIEGLSSRELHDRAVRIAVRRRDLGFLWDLAEALPLAEVISGNVRRAEADMLKISSLLADVFASGDPPVADALRPLYVDYLKRHAGDE